MASEKTLGSTKAWRISRAYVSQEEEGRQCRQEAQWEQRLEIANGFWGEVTQGKEQGKKQGGREIVLSDKMALSQYSVCIQRSFENVHIQAHPDQPVGEPSGLLNTDTP